jgi:hypothetical protein
MIVNEKGISLRDVWDGVNLRMTFTRTVDSRLMMWLELVQIASVVEFIEEDDSIIWQYRKIFDAVSAIVNNKGVVKPVYTL